MLLIPLGRSLVNFKSFSRPLAIKFKLTHLLSRCSHLLVLNKGYHGQDSVAEKPVQLREFTNDFKAGISHDGVAPNSWSPANETWEEESSSTRLNIAAVIVLLVSVIALVLSLLLVSGEIGEKCECRSNKG